VYSYLITAFNRCSVGVSVLIRRQENESLRYIIAPNSGYSLFIGIPSQFVHFIPIHTHFSTSTSTPFYLLLRHIPTSHVLHTFLSHITLTHPFSLSLNVSPNSPTSLLSQIHHLRRSFLSVLFTIALSYSAPVYPYQGTVNKLHYKCMYVYVCMCYLLFLDMLITLPVKAVTLSKYRVI